MPPDQDDFRRRALRAVLMVVGVAVVIGLVIGGLTSAAIRVTGVLPASTPTTSPTPDDEAVEDSLPTPVLKPTETPQTPASTPESPSPSPTKSTPTRSKSPKPDTPISLRASATTVSSYERVNLRGRYRGGNGTSLQIQRREGGSWSPFPTSASVEGGTFSTYVELGQPGANRLRALDTASGETSNVVVVRVS
ncbi:MAG: hypothetical protein ACRDOJ_05030 [Nocardioidaceae bacterium]